MYINLTLLVLWLIISLFFISFLLVLIKRQREAKNSFLKAEQINANLESENLNLNQKLSELELKYQSVLPYIHILDIDSEARRIKEESQFELHKANEKLKIILAETTEQAEKIIDDANHRAKDIIKNAEELRDNAKKFERIAQAMKNRIDGYGNEYIVPSSSIIDDLADKYSYSEAGQRLKESRERTKQMIRNREAADCDYVESSRKETAVDFVVDAFNGKVDSILSRVKHDNVGVLQQQIKDAFILVNYNGKSFRDARVNEAYLNVRLEELRWAAIAHELKLRDQEEQRRIREQIREEEKARKEYERVIKEAEKEEESLKKAIEKVRKETERAGESQRQEYETKLEQLSEKLRLAEEKNQRAISMAQQTRKGHVYVISNIGSFGENVFKIGMTRRLDPLDRVKELSDASVPFPFDVHAMIYSEDAPSLESHLHAHFLMNQVNKVNSRKEFFAVQLNQIKTELEKLGINASWTMTSEAREYRESLNFEKNILENPNIYSEWAKRQIIEFSKSQQFDGDDEYNQVTINDSPIKKAS